MNEFLKGILDGINSIIGNYGWSVVVFTLLILFWGIVRFSKIERTFVDTI